MFGSQYPNTRFHSWGISSIVRDAVDGYTSDAQV